MVIRCSPRAYQTVPWGRIALTGWTKLLGGNKASLHCLETRYTDSKSDYRLQSQGTRTSWNCLDFGQDPTKKWQQQMTKTQRRLASWGFFWVHPPIHQDRAGWWRCCVSGPRAAWLSSVQYYVQSVSAYS